ncbi:MAG: aminotransferase class IV [Bacteroidales bacterium]|nr:aminotransferase class IV [Bacteroidales bacterium]
MCRLFETIKVQDRKLHNIGYHNERFNRSRFEIFGLMDNITLEEAIEIPGTLAEGIYKCRVIYSDQIEKIEFEPYRQRKIKSLKLVQADAIDYTYKYLDRSEISRLFEMRNGCDDILIVKNGLITDTSFANIVFWDGHQWKTPTKPLLNGTKRQKLLLEGKMTEAVIGPQDIFRFKKAGIINAMLDFTDDFPEIEIKNIY